MQQEIVKGRNRALKLYLDNYITYHKIQAYNEQHSEAGRRKMRLKGHSQIKLRSVVSHPALGIKDQGSRKGQQSCLNVQPKVRHIFNHLQNKQKRKIEEKAMHESNINRAIAQDKKQLIEESNIIKGIQFYEQVVRGMLGSRKPQQSRLKALLRRRTTYNSEAMNKHHFVGSLEILQRRLGQLRNISQRDREKYERISSQILQLRANIQRRESAV